MRCLTGLMIAAALSIAGAGTAMADWKQNDTGWWYQYDDGSYASSGIKSINGEAYAFDQAGYMKTGWQSINGKWYYFQPYGGMALSWVQLDGKWYYLDPGDGGAMHTSWLNQGDKRYYMDSNGVMQTGIFFLGDDDGGSKYAYQADGSGALITGTTIRQGKSVIKYDERGRIKFRNAKTEKDAKRYGSDVWQPLLSQSQMDEIADSDSTVLREAEDALWDSYKSDVKKAKKAERPAALEEWKKEARQELADYLGSDDIEIFIGKVSAGV